METNFGFEEFRGSRMVLEASDAFAVVLSDSGWSTPSARAEGLRRFFAARLGTRGLGNEAFSARLSEQMRVQILPIALRAVGLEEAAARCATEGTKEIHAQEEDCGRWAVLEAAEALVASTDAAAKAARAALAAALVSANYGIDHLGPELWPAWDPWAAWRAWCEWHTWVPHQHAWLAWSSARVACYAAKAAGPESDAILTLAADIAAEILEEMKAAK